MRLAEIVMKENGEIMLNLDKGLIISLMEIYIRVYLRRVKKMEWGDYNGLVAKYMRGSGKMT